MACFGCKRSFETLTLLLAILLPFPGTSAWASVSAAEIGTVTNCRGMVGVKRPGQEPPLDAFRGLAISVGDIVSTGKGGNCQISLTDESFINLGEGTSVRVNQYAFDEKENRRSAVVQVLEGRARIVIYRQRSDNSRFRVESDIAEIDAEGLADFVVDLRPEGTEAIVLQRSLAIRNRSALYVGGFRLGQGQKALVRRNRPPDPPKTISQKEQRQLLKALQGR